MGSWSCVYWVAQNPKYAFHHSNQICYARTGDENNIFLTDFFNFLKSRKSIIFSNPFPFSFCGCSCAIPITVSFEKVSKRSNKFSTGFKIIVSASNKRIRFKSGKVWWNTTFKWPQPLNFNVSRKEAISEVVLSSLISKKVFFKFGIEE